MTVRKIVLLVGLLLLPLAALAQEGARTYTIKKGDTLWGVSERFLKDPYYWPNLWSHNPFIANPHFIYPGQEVAIYDGRIEIVPAAPEATEPTEAQAPAEVAPVPAPVAQPEPVETITVRTLGGAEGFIADEELVSAGTLVDTTDNRLLMATGDRVFLEMNDPGTVGPGDAFTIFELGREVRHPASGTLLGYQVVVLGSLRVVGIEDSVATAVITEAHQEIRRGARLLPLRSASLEVELKQAEHPLSGTLVAARGGQIALGQNDIIYIDLGSAEGLEVGNLLYISRPRKPTRSALQDEDLQLPDVLLGSAVVLETGTHTASALVLKSVDSLFRGDRVQTVTE